MANSMQALNLRPDGAAGIQLVGLDSTLYDQILDTIYYLGIAPARFEVRSITLLGDIGPQASLMSSFAASVAAVVYWASCVHALACN